MSGVGRVGFGVLALSLCAVSIAAAAAHVGSVDTEPPFG